MKFSNFTIYFLNSLLIYGVTSCSADEEKTETLPTDESIAVKIAPLMPSKGSASIKATGLLGTKDDARYSFKIGGVIEKVLIKEGQYFKKGQLLATLQLDEINAQLKQAQLAEEKAQRDYDRAKNLFDDKIATLEQLENAKTGLDVAKETVTQVKFNQKYGAIYASSSGFVSEKLANEGEIVAPGTPVLLINESNNNLGWVLKVGVDGAEWASIKEGTSAIVTLDSYPNQSFAAKVTRKSQVADPMSGSFIVEVNLVGVRKKLAIGLFGKAEIFTNTANEGYQIPYEALVEANGNEGFVYSPISETEVRKVPVSIESFDNERIIVKSGLENVAEIVVSNSPFLNEKSTIKIIK